MSYVLMPAKRRRRVFTRQQRNTTQAVASDILQARELTRLRSVADEPPMPMAPPVLPTLAQLASTLKLCKHTGASVTLSAVPYDRIHSSGDADNALRELLAMHELARQQHGERLPPAVYTDISYSLHVQRGHPFRAADKVRFKVNNLKKRKLDAVLFPPRAIGRELYALSAMPSAAVSDWARSEVGLPASAIDNAMRRLDGSILRLLYSVAVHDGGDVVALVRRLLCNLFAGSDSTTTIDQLCVCIAAQRFPSWVVAKAAAAPAAVDEYGWLRRKNDALAGKSSRQ